MTTAASWSMLRLALLERLEGYEVTHALFTTFSFDPEFFEAQIIPLLFRERDSDLSLHSAVRRLQLEEKLRRSPKAIDVFFDARVVVPGTPWLPYGMHPVKRDGEFHGKVMLLLLRDQGGRESCLLGAGSANLTRAGWWDNLEAWHFEPVFSLASPPARLLGGLRALMRLLPSQGQAREEFARRIEGVRGRAGDGPVFRVFPDESGGFAEWWHERVAEVRSRQVVEVISPYFPESDAAPLVEALCPRGTRDIRLWLPADPWHFNGKAAQIEADRYRHLSSTPGIRWCRFRESSLQAQRSATARPRFLHAKVIRLPGELAFVGSVNFSHKAFRLNFEAGFEIADAAGGSWLEPTDDVPERFEAPVAAAEHQGCEPMPAVGAVFDWRMRCLALDFGSSANRRDFVQQEFRVLDASGVDAELRVRVPARGKAELAVAEGQRLYRSLQGSPWIKLCRPDGGILVAWVRQEGLDFRPPPAELTPDVWRIIDMWRVLEGGEGGEGGMRTPDYGALEVMLTRVRGSDEEGGVRGDDDDLFAAISQVHGSFHALRTRLRAYAEAGDAHLAYYFSARKLDTLPTLLGQMEQLLGQDGLDVVKAWTVLMWVRQIAGDHLAGRQKCREARGVRDMADALLARLLVHPAFAGIDRRWLQWVGEMFFCEPGREAALTQRLQQAWGLA